MAEAQALYFKPILCFLSFFIIWGGISIFWAESSRAVIYHTLTWSIYLAVFVFTISYLQTTKNLNPLITIFIFLSLILTVNVVVDLLTVEALVNIGNFKVDVQYPRIRYAKFAEMLVTFAPLLWIIPIYRKKGKDFYFLTFIAIISWLGIMLSLSKSAFLGGAIGFVFCFVTIFLFSKKMFRKRILLLAFLWISLTISHQVTFSNFSNIESTANFATAKAEKENKTTSFRLFVWKVSGVMIKENLLKGVGANNFGIALNDYRIEYAELFPNDPGHTTAEDHLVERTHNEYLQIFAELGLIGGITFLLILTFFGIWIFSSFMKNKFRASPLFFGSLAGAMAFLISSLSSSFSFRLMQNGIVFIMILSILVYELIKMEKRFIRNNPSKFDFKLSLNKPVFASVFLVLFSMSIFSAATAVSNFYVYLGENETNSEKAIDYFDKALLLSSENTAAYSAKSGRFFAEKKMAESAVNLQRSIDMGLGTVISYSYLAEAYEKSGDIKSAEKTLAKAVKIYPHSVFGKVRYSLFLEKIGKNNLACEQMQVAENLDSKSAKGWHNLIKYRSKKAFLLAKDNNNITQPAALKPKNANMQFMDEMVLPKPDRK